jgi:vacuolar-type H+-ATPase subunit I/STV1
VNRLLIIFLSSLVLSGFVIAKSYTPITTYKETISADYNLDNEKISLIDVAGGDLKALVQDDSRILNFENELKKLKQLNYNLEKDIAGVQKYVYNINQYADHGLAEEIANLKIDPKDLEKYATQKLDVAEYEIEDGITYELDIVDHGRKLYEESDLLVEQSIKEEDEVGRHLGY